MKLTIRKATLKDLDLIEKLWIEFKDNHDCGIICANPSLKAHTDIKKNASKIFKKFLKSKITSKDAYVQLAYVDNEVAGYNLSYVLDNIPVFSLEKLGYVGDLFVKKEYRGLKISSKFKENAFNFFRKKKLKYASIKVWQENHNAHDIYEKWGFKDLHLEMRKKL